MRQRLIEAFQKFHICIFRKSQVEEAHSRFRNYAMQTARPDDQNRGKL